MKAKLLFRISVALVASALVGACAMAGAADPATAAVKKAVRAYVTNFCPSSSNCQSGPGSVFVIDVATNAVLATIGVGNDPRGVAVTPDGRHAYVANNCGSSTNCTASTGTVSVIKTSTNAVVATVTVAGGPRGVAITPDGKKAYVVSVGCSTNCLSVINTATNTVTAQASVFGAAIAISPNGTRAYIASSGCNTPGCLHGTVTVVNTATNAVLATIPIGVSPSAVAVSPDGKHVYAVNQCESPTNCVNGTVSVIDTGTNKVVATVVVGDNPLEVAVTPDGTRAYVTNFYGSGPPSPGTVSVIDTGTNTVVNTVTLPASSASPVGVAITPDGSEAYVVSGTTVTVVDTATNTVASTITVGSPVNVAIANVPLR